jgi:sugar/nucleoside kinase (ribokinase family)
MASPELLVIGQITVDHIVPATPGAWRCELGGNALYAAAGARLWTDASRIGIVAFLGRGIEREAHASLAAAQLPLDGLRPLAIPAMVEWFLYEEDGSRQTVPRLPELRDPAVPEDVRRARYLAHLESLSAGAEDIPAGWRSPKAVHLAPQVGSRHSNALQVVRAHAFVTVDPSPHYTRSMSAADLATFLAGAGAILPSEADIAHLVSNDDWPKVVEDLVLAGLPEVVLKLGSRGVLLATRLCPRPVLLPAAHARVIDPTGAGDAFGGAYVANRATGVEPLEATLRALATAALVIESQGAAAALAISPSEVRIRRAAMGE